MSPSFASRAFLYPVQCVALMLMMSIAFLFISLVIIYECDVATSLKRSYIPVTILQGVFRVHQWPSQPEGVLLNLLLCVIESFLRGTVTELP